MRKHLKIDSNVSFPAQMAWAKKQLFEAMRMDSGDSLWVRAEGRCRMWMSKLTREGFCVSAQRVGKDDPRGEGFRVFVLSRPAW